MRDRMLRDQIIIQETNMRFQPTTDLKATLNISMGLILNGRNGKKST